MKKLEACLIVLLILGSMTAFYAPKKASADAYTTAIMNPSNQDSWMYYGSGSGNGTVYEMSVDIVITNVTDMAGWQFGLYWDNSALNCDSAVIHEPNIWTNNTIHVDFGVNNAYNSTNGYYFYAEAAEWGYPSFNGTLTIATLTFHQLANVSATTPLNFDGVEVCDYTGNLIDCSAEDGSVLMHTGAKPTIVTISGNGNTIQLDPYPYNWANWNCSRTNDGDASYVSSNGEGVYGCYDLYNASFSWLPANISNIVATVHIVVRSTTSLHRASFKTLLCANSTGLRYGGSFNELSSYNDESYSFNITQNDAATLQIGVQINDGSALIGGMYFYYPGHCTQVYAVIIWS